jgi:hypothetical protein
LHVTCNVVCLDHATVVVTTSLARSVTIASTTKICVDLTVCSRITFDANANATVTGAFGAYVQLDDANGSAVLTIDVIGDHGEWFRDGDLWSVAISDPQTNPLFSASRIVTYTLTSPDCDGVECHELMLALP